MSGAERTGAGTRPAAIITGASRRIGRALALALAADGWPLVLSWRSDEAGAEATREAAAALGVPVETKQADLSVPEDAAALVGAGIALTGRLGLLVNNAARFDPTPLSEMDATSFDQQMHANARGPYLLMAAAGRHMQAEGRGVILNIADVAGLSAWPSHVPYSASKAALVSLTQGFARLLAPTVRVVAIAPGPILAPAGAEEDDGSAAVQKTLLKRFGDPADIVAAARFLLRASYVTGYTLPVDGGRSV